MVLWYLRYWILNFEVIKHEAQTIIVHDDAFFQPELGWSVWGSLGWTKTVGGLNWRMPDRLAVERLLQC